MCGDVTATRLAPHEGHIRRGGMRPSHDASLDIHASSSFGGARIPRIAWTNRMPTR
jgi:hypothetical protein